MPPPSDPQSAGTSGRSNEPHPDPESQRPWATNVDLQNCPHCGVEASDGHYVCWNCSKDLREPTEEEVRGEFHSMLASQDLRRERSNLRFQGVAFLLGIGLAALAVPLWWDSYRGMPFLFGVIALIAAVSFLRTRRKVAKIVTYIES